MNDSMRTEWINLAQEQPRLRYPTISLFIQSPFSYVMRGKVRMETFVQSRDKDRLVLMRSFYDTYHEGDIWKDLELFKKVFTQQCDITAEKYIFIDSTSVMEPYEFNKNK